MLWFGNGLQTMRMRFNTGNYSDVIASLGGDFVLQVTVAGNHPR
jgi:hypothetical protein